MSESLVTCRVGNDRSCEILLFGGGRCACCWCFLGTSNMKSGSFSLFAMSTGVRFSRNESTDSLSRLEPVLEKEGACCSARLDETGGGCLLPLLATEAFFTAGAGMTGTASRL